MFSFGRPRIWMYVVNILMLLDGLVVATRMEAFLGVFRALPLTIEEYSTYPSYYFVLIGIIMLLIAIMGIWATKTDDTIFLAIYQVITLCLIFVQVGTPLILKARIDDKTTLQDLLNPFFNNFTHSGTATSAATSVATSTIDAIQHQFKCCGLQGHSYWKRYHNMSELPLSCAFTTEGCTDVVYNILHIRVNNMLSMFGISVAIELVSVFVAKELRDLLKERRAESQDAIEFSD